MGVGEVASRRAVFFDRDGVLNEAVVRDGRPYPPESSAELRVTSGAETGLRQLRDANYRLFVVTNQPDVARGTALRSTVEAINARLADALPIERFYICYHSGDACDCRKPKPGLIHRAVREHYIDLQQSWLVGDRWRDIAAGHAAGIRTILIDYAYEESFQAGAPDFCVTSLTDAIARILMET